MTDSAAHTPLALYDLESDPYEQRNLVDDPAAHSVVEALRHDLDAWLSDVASRTGDTCQAPLTSPAFGHRMVD